MNASARTGLLNINKKAANGKKKILKDAVNVSLNSING